MFDRRAKSAFIVSCVVIAACGLSFQWAVGHLNYYLRKEPIAMRASFSTIPDAIGSWHKYGEDQILDKAMVEELGTDKYLNRVYLGKDEFEGLAVVLHMAYYTGMIDAVPHVPDRCMVAAGYNAKSLPENVPLTVDTSEWQPDPVYTTRSGKPYPVARFRHYFTGQEIMVRMPVDELALRITEFEDESAPDVRVFAGYLFLANGGATAAPEGVRTMAFDPTEKYAYYCKLQFNMKGTRSLTRAQFVDTVSAFLKDLLPEVMRCLPDWAEVEAAGVKGSDLPAGS